MDFYTNQIELFVDRTLYTTEFEWLVAASQECIKHAFRMSEAANDYQETNPRLSATFGNDVNRWIRQGEIYFYQAYPKRLELLLAERDNQ